MKRGQMDIAPIYILGGIILLLILAFGYNSVGRLRDTEGQISSLRLYEELRKDIKQMSTDFGSARVFSYKAPKDVSVVCFFSKLRDGFLHNPQGCPTQDVALASLFVDKSSNKNLFLIGDTLKGSYSVENLYLGDCELVCFNAMNSKLSLRMEGLGDKTLIKNA